MPIGFNPTLYQLSAYTAPLIVKPVHVCTTKNHQSQVMPVILDWVTVAPTFALSVNANQGANGLVLVGGIQGVYVDNSNNLSDLILVFPDTGYTILTPAETSQFFPVFSNTGICNVYNGALSNTMQAAGQSIILLFTNFLMHPFETTGLQNVAALLLGSSLTNGNASYIANVKGDQHLDNVYNISVAGVGLLIPLPPIVEGKYIITNLQVGLLNCYSTTSAFSLSVGIRYGTAGFVRTLNPVIINTDDKYVPYTIIYSHDDEYLSLDATQTINAYWTAGVAGGFAHFSFDFAWITSQ
jgi:hypothetical protein